MGRNSTCQVSKVYQKKLPSIEKTKRRWEFFLFSLIEEPQCLTGFEFTLRNKKGPGDAPATNPPTAAQLWCIPQEQQWNPQLPPLPHIPRDTCNAILRRGLQEAPSTTLNTILQLKSELAFSVQPQRDSAHFN